MLTYINEKDAYEQFNAMLDENSTINIMGVEYNTSYALKAIDEPAYDMHFINWLDANDLTIDEDEADEEE